VTRALVLGARSPPRFEPTDATAFAGAIDLAPIARLADVNLSAAAGAQEHADTDVYLLLDSLLLHSGRLAWQRTCPGHQGRGSCAGEAAMAKIGRNEPCPCGSGKKYKRCCQANPVQTPPPTALRSDVEHEATSELCPCCVERLEEQADRVTDELVAGRLDHAEALCQKLIADFPTEAEGLDLLSMILQERGERERALELLRRASAIAHARSEYDSDVRSDMRVRIRQLEPSA
jgi:tetratricopeptide (TPR) repeat protein